MMIKTVKYFISLVLAIQIGFSPNITWGEGADFLSPRAIWKEKLEPYSLVFMVNAISLLRGGQSISEFRRSLKGEGLEAVLYHLEEERGVVQAVRFRSHDGKWYRLGKRPLGKTDPELGFLLSSQTSQVDEFWLETFDRTSPVEIIVPGVVLGTVVKIEEGVNFKEYQPQSVEPVDFEGHKPKDTPGVDLTREEDLIERMEKSVLDQYQRWITEAEGEPREILEADRGLVNELVDKVRAEIGPTVNVREAIGRVFSVYVRSFSESEDPKFHSKAQRLKRMGEMMMGDLERAVLEKMQEVLLERYDRMMEGADKDQAEILEGERLMMADLIGHMKELIEPHVNAREAVMRVIQKYIKVFGDKKDTYFQQKVTDIETIGWLMIDYLDGVDRLAILDRRIAKLAEQDQKVILVGRILPSHFSLGHRRAVVGMVTDYDEQRGSHNMVLAQGAQVAFAKKASHVSSLEKELRDGDAVALELVISDRSGKSSLTLNPEPTHRFRIIRQGVERGVYEGAVTALKARTRDDRPVRLDLNVATHEELNWRKGEYRRIGLTRSDFDYLGNVQAPTLESLTRKYEKFFGRAMELGVEEVTFRTFDLDLSDKKPLCFRNPDRREGIDFSLNDPEGLEAFKVQVRSVFLGLASHLDEGVSIKLKLLFPKVRRLKEYRRAVRIMSEIFEELRRGDPRFERLADYKVGIMVETQEALENIESFIGEVDFINVGTNDLTLSLFPEKVSRVPKEGKAPISAYYHRVLGPLERIIKAAAAHPNVQRRPPICFCGELSTRAEYAQFLEGLGYPKLSLSMPYKSVLDLKLNIAAHDYAEIQEYTKELLVRVRHAQALTGEQAEKAYEELREFLRDKRAEMEENTLAYLAYEWARHNISLDQLIEVLQSVSATLEQMVTRDELVQNPDQMRREVASMLAVLGVFPEPFKERLLERGVDVDELLTMLEVWAYQKLIDQGTFYVYRARRVGNDYWIRTLPTGIEYRLRSRYDRRILKEDDGSVWIRTGPDRRVEARRVVLESEPDAEIYAYEDRGQTFYARNMEVRGVPFTYVRAGPEKSYIIERFLKGEAAAPLYAHDERLHPDGDGKVQIIHIPDWRRHPVFKDLPYELNKATHSLLLFLLDVNRETGEITLGQNAAKPGLGHLFDDNSRILEVLIRKLKLASVSIRVGRGNLRLIKAQLEASRALQEVESLRRRVRELETLLERAGIPQVVIADPALFDQAA